LPAPVESVALSPQRVPAYFLRPQDATACPALLLQHGYGSQKSDLLPLGMILAACGFATLLPDAHGHGERAGDGGPEWWSRMSADTFIDTTRYTVDDLCAALEWLERRDDVRSDAIALGGFSMGAMAALIVGTEDPRPAAIISVAGSPMPDLANALRLGMGAPSERASEWVLAHDAAAKIGRFAPKPLLLQHGRRDDVVPVAGTLRLHEAAKPHYAAHPERLALMLYDHAHTGTEEQLQDAITWMAPFLVDEAAAA
jgi:predicted esterase